MLNAYLLPEEVAFSCSGERSHLLATLVFEFQNTFTGIHYEIDARTRIVNAQAFYRSGSRFVRLYGGFAYHPLVSEDALVFTFLHETGHHLASGRRFVGDPGLACDCYADKWAIGAGARLLRHRSGRVLKLADALGSLDALMQSIDAKPLRRAKRSPQPQACWAGLWTTRKSHLSCCSAPVPTGPCYYSR
jgi:hypothetical protein